MDFRNKTADLYVPDGKPIQDALTRTSHLGICSAQDELEVAALHGVIECFGNAKQWFAGVVCTDGAESARTSPYVECSDRQMAVIRMNEQKEASRIGQYGLLAQLNYPSGVIRDPKHTALSEDLADILTATRPKIVYTHNPLARNDTHISIFVSVVEALRRVHPGRRPEKLYCCETWRGLEWVPETDRVVLDVSERTHLGDALLGLYDTQLADGLRFDQIFRARREANAGLLLSHRYPNAKQVIYAIDMSRLMSEDSINTLDFVVDLIDRFSDDIRERLGRRFGQGHAKPPGGGRPPPPPGGFDFPF